MTSLNLSQETLTKINSSLTTLVELLKESIKEEKPGSPKSSEADLVEINYCRKSHFIQYLQELETKLIDDFLKVSEAVESKEFKSKYSERKGFLNYNFVLSQLLLKNSLKSFKAEKNLTNHFEMWEDILKINPTLNKEHAILLPCYFS